MKKITNYFAVMMALLLLSGCTEMQFASNTVKTALPHHQGPSASGNEGAFKVGNPYQVEGEWYYPREQYDLVETGLASWYGPGFDGHYTASGEVYHSDELTAAHRTLQMPSLVRVTNLDNGRSIVVRVNDRGPYRRGRIMDVSSKAADLLGMKGTGTAKVKLQVLSAESMRVAQMAKTGASTRGYEMAMNGAPGQMPPGEAEPAETESALNAHPLIQTASLEAVPLTPVMQDSLQEPPAGPVAGHMNQGKFYPDPVVTQLPVTATGIYVQAGSFMLEGNAERLRDKLQAFGTVKVEEASIGARHFYRVRLGPAPTVDAADALLSRMIAAGYGKAIIMVE